MTRLLREIDDLARVYCRHGGKSYRRRHKGMWRAFARFCEPLGCYSLGQIGKKQIETFFADLKKKGRTNNTLYEYKLALTALFEAADRTPPAILARIENPKPTRAERQRRRIQRQWQEVAANDPIFENSEPLPPPHPCQP
ncbi:hypothetical protein [Candidatus Igneacidithiobacillus taiwanensis]|uniref:hypothetical protein n=1 Tax=Candidatus Igneacidithiobacillus taiwanensis TaxID=1945924 RepID=UPI00289A38F9|nr:hypothetical protein [Candidatus Igneacidithiobacillus taiwanensis]